MNNEIISIKSLQEDAYKDNLYKLEIVYIICSVLYYSYDYSIISDDKFDEISKKLLDNYNLIRLSNVIDKDSLSAGTGYDIDLEKLPSRLKYLALEVIEDYELNYKGI